jgi:hypothetical protein
MEDKLMSRKKQNPAKRAKFRPLSVPELKTVVGGNDPKKGGGDSGNPQRYRDGGGCGCVCVCEP